MYMSCSGYIPAVFGLVYVLATAYATSVLGFAIFFVAVLLGQLIIASILDHYGMYDTYMRMRIILFMYMCLVCVTVYLFSS